MQLDLHYKLTTYIGSLMNRCYSLVKRPSSSTVSLMTGRIFERANLNTIYLHVITSSIRDTGSIIIRKLIKIMNTASSLATMTVEREVASLAQLCPSCIIINVIQVSGSELIS